MDKLLLQKQICQDIDRARSLILAGAVLVNGQKVTKSGVKFSSDSEITTLDKIPHYVSRGAYKLKHAIETFNIQAQNKIAIDLGSSTGGFTQVLLELGVEKVYAFDVGYGQMVSKIRNHPNVTVKDRFNVKNISWAELETVYKKILIVMDLSFISLFSVFPSLFKLKQDSLHTQIEVVSLIKPQFECAKSELAKGVVKDREVHFRIIKKFIKYIKEEMKGEILGLTVSPITGREGNKEFLLYWKI